MREELIDLIKRMCVFEPAVNSTESTSWHAHRAAENLDALELVDELQEFLAQKPDKDERRAAYFIIGKIGKNKTDSNCGEILIGYIRSERDKYALSTLLNVLADIQKRSGADLSPVFELLTDGRWLVRHSAINALKNTSSQQAEEKLLELLQRARDAQDMIYCHSTLGRIGSTRAIPTIERGLKSRKRDVKLSAEQAIASIAQRVAIF